MMNATISRITLSLLAAVALLAGATSTRAGNSCTDEAKGDYKDCRAACVEGVQATKDAGLGRDHDCVEQCRTERAGCRDATGIDDALAACDATLAAAKQACRDHNPPGTDRDQCIDQAQVVGFQCRDDARDA